MEVEDPSPDDVVEPAEVGEEELLKLEDDETGGKPAPPSVPVLMGGDSGVFGGFDSPLLEPLVPRELAELLSLVEDKEDEEEGVVVEVLGSLLTAEGLSDFPLTNK